MPNVYFAPLEGITNATYRRVHARHFPGVEKYYMPFTSPASHLKFSSREQFELAPANNTGLAAVPQLLTKDAALFNDMARLLADVGYTEINLNLGCPSPTVTSKNKGSGMLKDVDALERFLDGIFASPRVAISVKTRLGFDSTDEWPPIAELLARYPISELTLHPRTRKELYSGLPHWDCLKQLENAPFPIIPNGNLFSRADCEIVARLVPDCRAVMLGRGLVANPALARELIGGAPLGVPELRDFHDDLYESYAARWPENAVAGHMHEIMNYVARCFADCDKQYKALRKSKTAKDYRQAANRLFEECPLKKPAAYSPN